MKWIRIALIVIGLALFGNAVGGGWYGISGAPNVPLEWLDGTPFSSYLIPGLTLLIAVGGSMLAATIAWLFLPRLAAWVSLGAGVVLIGWIVVQLSFIGYVSALQPICFVAGTLMAALSIYVLHAARRQPAPVAPGRKSVAATL